MSQAVGVRSQREWVRGVHRGEGCVLFPSAVVFAMGDFTTWLTPQITPTPPRTRVFSLPLVARFLLLAIPYLDF